MKTHFALFLLAGALLAASCSQADPMPLDEYAVAITGVTQAYVLESQEITLRYQLGVEDQVDDMLASGVEGNIEGAMIIVRSETANFLALLDDAMGRYHTGITELTPPLSVAAPHEAYLEIIASVRSTLPASRDALAETSTFEDVIASLVGSGFADGQQAWRSACQALESAIRDAGRGADLKCVRDPVTG